MVAEMALFPRRNFTMRFESFRLAVAGAAAGVSSRRSRLALLATLALGLAAGAAALVDTSSASVDRRGAATLSGAGSSFVFPLVSQWIPVFDEATGITVRYNPIGSGGGISAITARTVDFGASDAPLTRDQFSACKGCVQIPWALSATSIPYNIPGLNGRLKLNGRVLAQIYLNQIQKWNDARIRALNKGLNLPNLDITPVHRSDNSGTSYNFTDYLASASSEWKSRIGVGVNANWPTGVGGQGSSGMAAAVSRTSGAVGYVDVAYSLKNHLPFALIQNKSGKYATPGLRGIAGAAATVRRVPASNELSIVNPPKGFRNAYPICTFTYIILPTKTDKAAELRRFVFWALTSGQKYGPRLLFVRIPKPVLVSAEKTLKKVKSQ
jgi:phosphate transport system substrate-binding protein